MPANLPPTITCSVTHIADADTVRCSDRRYIRLAGISALERDGSCNSTPFCSTMPDSQARPIATRLMLGRTIRFRIYGRSGVRLVGDNPAVRCALIRSGAAVAWPKYVVRYHLTEACR